MTTPVNGLALLPVQGAMFARIKADAALNTAIGGRVYDDVPENAAYPYVVFGEGVETPDNEVAAYESRVAATLHVWSGYRGFREALVIAGHLIRVFDRQPLVVEGRDLIAVRHEQTITMRDPDSDVRHVVVRFAVVTNPNTI
jgi:hypothetical protein